MDETRKRLLEAAGQVFAEVGYEPATIREICRRADANVAAVNYHFGDKRKLYFEAVKFAHGQYDEQPQTEWPAGTAPEQKLRDFLREAMNDMLDQTSPGWQIELIMREMANPTDACEALVKGYIGPKFDVLMGILDEFLPADMPMLERHLFAFSVVGQCLLYRYHRPVGRLLVGEAEYQAFFDVEKLTDHILRFSLPALLSFRTAARGRVESNTDPNSPKTG